MQMNKLGKLNIVTALLTAVFLFLIIPNCNAEIVEATEYKSDYYIIRFPEESWYTDSSGDGTQFFLNKDSTGYSGMLMFEEHDLNSQGLTNQSLDSIQRDIQNSLPTGSTFEAKSIVIAGIEARYYSADFPIDNQKYKCCGFFVCYENHLLIAYYINPLQAADQNETFVIKMCECVQLPKQAVSTSETSSIKTTESNKDKYISNHGLKLTESEIEVIMETLPNEYQPEEIGSVDYLYRIMFAAKYGDLTEKQEAAIYESIDVSNDELSFKYKPSKGRIKRES